MGKVTRVEFMALQQLKFKRERKRSVHNLHSFIVIGWSGEVEIKIELNGVMHIKKWKRN